jgi:AraC-like DNA-binding protein
MSVKSVSHVSFGAHAQAIVERHQRVPEAPMLEQTTDDTGIEVQAEQHVSNEALPLFQERGWRRLEPSVINANDDIAISRWTDAENLGSQAEATSSPNRYFVAIALKTTRLRLTRGNTTIFGGIMPTGSLYVSAPTQELKAHFETAFDFLHLHIPVAFFSDPQSARAASTGHLNDFVLLRSQFVEQLARALIEKRHGIDRRFARCIAQTLAMHIAQFELPQTNALAKWRLRRVEEYVKLNLRRPIGLVDLANVAGLSRMHFAAQFRAATGYRPREYLTHRRIENARSSLSETENSIAEVALDAGYSSQAYFSTVFKRVTGQTPARWRAAHKREAQSTLEPSSTEIHRRVRGASGREADRFTAALP